MELRHLRSFLVLADELHFGRAAARLHLAQSSLSQHLQQLERHVGVALLDRGPHHVRLTEAGRTFRSDAQGVVDGAAHAVSAARAVAAGGTGTVDVGFNLLAGQRVLPGALARLTDRHPGVTVRLTERRTGPAHAALAAGELDVVLGYGRPAAAGLRSRELLRAPVVALVGAAHPLAGRSALPVAELAGERCVLFRRELCPALHDAVVGAAARAGVLLDIAEEVDDSVAAGVVLAGRPLVGFASAVRAAEAPVRGLAAVPLVDPVPEVPLHAAWRAGAGPLVAAVLAALLQGTDGPTEEDRGG